MESFGLIWGLAEKGTHEKDQIRLMNLMMMMMMIMMVMMMRRMRGNVGRVV